MDIREKINELVYRINGGICPDDDVECREKTCRECYINHILSLETDTERIGVYLKEPVLPENPYPEKVFPEPTQEWIENAVECLKSNGFSSDILHGSWGRHVFNFCQQDMIDPKKGRFVQLKEGE